MKFKLKVRCHWDRRAMQLHAVGSQEAGHIRRIIPEGTKYSELLNLHTSHIQTLVTLYVRTAVPRKLEKDAKVFTQS